MGQRENLKDILNRRLAHYGLGKAALAARVCAVAQQVSEGKFEVVSFKDGILKIAVCSVSEAHMIRLSQNKLIAKVNQKLGQGLVKKIRFDIQ